MTARPGTIRSLTDSGLEVTTTRGVVVVDLGEYTPHDLVSPDLALAICTHQHSDHCDSPRLAALSLPVWGPPDTLPPLQAAGVREAFPLVVGGTTNIDGNLTVTAMPVDHGKISKPIDNVGLILEVDGLRILHAGDLARDTTPHPTGAFDLIVVPIGGEYVLDARGAADYVDGLGHRGPVLGVHYDYAPAMAAAFIDAAANRPWTAHILAPGQEIQL